MAGRYPTRIVCLTEETTETLYLLGAEDCIVGISGFTRRPPRARREKPKVSTYLEADVEAIVALRPDLVIGFSDLQADMARDLVRRGLDVLVTNQRSIEEILRTIAVVGAVVGRAAQAERLSDQLRAGLREIEARAAQLPRRPRVFFEEWPEPLIAGIRWVSELVEVAGGEDVFPELRSAGLGKDRIVSPAEVARRDPQLVIASWCGKKVKPAVILERPGWEGVSAVRSGRVVEVKSEIILQPGPAALTDGVRALFAHIEKAAREL